MIQRTSIMIKRLQSHLKTGVNHDKPGVNHGKPGANHDKNERHAATVQMPHIVLEGRIIAMFVFSATM